jgi:hypothetical protein
MSALNGSGFVRDQSTEQKDEGGTEARRQGGGPKSTRKGGS